MAPPQTMLFAIPFSQTSAIVIAIAVMALCLVAFKRQRGHTSRLPLPPGPPAHWLLGNTMPSSYAHRKFEEWTEEYGPVFTLRRGTKITVVIGRHQAAVNIMEKEGGSLVDRPVYISAGETLSGGMRTLLVGAGNRLRRLRRALHARLSITASHNYEPIQMANAKNLILDILKNPKNHQDHAKQYAASVIMTMTYGKSTTTSYTDYEVIQVNKCLRRFGMTMLPGAWLIDSYPILRHVPGYLNQLKQWHKEELQLFSEQIDVVKKDMAKGQALDSFAKFLIEHQKEYELSDNEVAYLAGSMFGAGSDTTASAISTMVMAAAAFPEAQKKVQEELDLVIVPGKAPTFGDENMLPQTQAFVLETYRWRPVTVGGVAHRATKDIIWRNYCIPAGTSVIGNHWSIGLDPAVYPNPHKFDPQRWLTEDGRIRHDLKPFQFGFGRRTCPGQHVADRSIFINTLLHLWAFRISELPSAPLDILGFFDAMNTHPLPFQVKFEPRIKEAELQAILTNLGGVET